MLEVHRNENLNLHSHQRTHVQAKQTFDIILLLSYWLGGIVIYTERSIFYSANYSWYPEMPSEMVSCLNLVSMEFQPLNILLPFIFLMVRLVQQKLQMNFQERLAYLWQRIIRGRSYRHLMKESGYKR